MIVLGLFFWLMALVNYGIHQKHKTTSEELQIQYESLTGPDEMEKNRKAYKFRISAMKTTNLSVAVLGGAGCLMFLLAMT